MNIRIYRNNLILIIWLFFNYAVLISNEEGEIKSFLESIKSQADVKLNTNFGCVLNFGDFTSVQHLNMICLLFNIKNEDIQKNMKEGFSNEALYNMFIEKEFIKGIAEKIDIKIFSMPFEIKKLKDGEILILFDDKKRFKVPILLLRDGDKFKFDVRAFVTTIPVLMLNAQCEGQTDIISYATLLSQGSHIYLKREQDYSYLVGYYDKFKKSKDKDIINLLVHSGAYFSSVLKINGSKLLEKNINLDTSEKNLIAAQLNFSINILKDRKLDEIKVAYDIAEEIINTMSDEEKTIYLIGKK